MPPSPKLDEYCDYLLNNYIADDCVFPATCGQSEQGRWGK